MRDAIRSLASELVALIRDEPELRDQLRAALADPKATEPDEFFGTSAAARHAKVSTRTIARWLDSGRLARYQAGRCVRVKRSDLEALLRSNPRDRGRGRELTPEEQARRDFG